MQQQEALGTPPVFVSGEENIREAVENFPQPPAFTPARIRLNLVTGDVREYALREGLHYEEHLVVTADGHVLVVHRVSKQPVEKRGCEIPVLCVHGLLQRAGVFIAGGKRSLAVYLAGKGFDVWMANSRGVFPYHVNLSPDQRKYWDWGLDELGHFDIPAVISYIKSATNKKIVYIGHSQGAGQAFIALEDFPHLNSDIALLVGLAPAFFVHQPPPPHGWFIRDVLMKMSEKNLHKFFGEKGFLRPMLQVQKHTPSKMFSFLGYRAFRYLFGWDDSIWEPGCRDSYFQFTPAQTSTKLVAHWMHNMKIGRIVRHRSGLVPLSDPSAHVPLLSVSSPLPSSSSKIVTPWAPRESHAELQPHHKLGRTNKSTSKVKCLNGEDHDDRNENENHGREEHEPKHEAVHAAEYEGEEGELIVGLEKVDCPVAIFHAMGDTVANGDRLASELMVNRRNKASGGAAGAVVHYGSLPGYGHMDVLWAHDAATVVFEPIVGLIRRFYN